MTEKVKKSFPWLIVILCGLLIGLTLYFQETKADVATTTLTVGNVVPVVQNVSLNAGANISPEENTTKAVNITGQVVDDNGWGDVTNITARAFRSGQSIT